MDSYPTCKCDNTCKCEICNEEKLIEKMNAPANLNSRLLNKNWSPLIVRKYQFKGWPMFVALICDANLDDLDVVVNNAEKEFGEIKEGIQSARNWCGFLSDYIVEYYNKIKSGVTEGVAVLWYIDKCFISSLYGDFMVHASCKQELYFIINTLPII